MPCPKFAGVGCYGDASLKDMLHMGSTLRWGQEVWEGVAAQCVDMKGLERTGIEGPFCVRMQCS